MAYCRNCGYQLEESTKICPLCSAEQMPIKPIKKETGGIGYFFLGFIMPYVGFILYFLWRHDKPKPAKYSGIGALIFSAIYVIFMTIFILGFRAPN